MTIKKRDALRAKSWRLIRTVGRIGRVFGAIILICGIFAAPTLAMDEPDTTPTITFIRANENLIETGDILIYGRYAIPYATPPTTPSTEAYIFRLMDTDGTTELGSITPSAFFDNGYNEGAFGFYFSADDNTLTSGQPYKVQIYQNPSQFATPQSWEYALDASSWTTKTTQDDNQTELALNIISTAEWLEYAYTDDDITLLESSAGSTVLSDPDGEMYFRGAIYGIQFMSPSLFLVQVLSQDTADRAWTTDQFDTYQDRFSGTWVGDATDNVSGEFGLTSTAFMGLIYLLPISLGAIILSTIKFRRAEPGFMVACIAMLCTVLMGWFSIPLFATLFQLMAIYIGYLWFYARSS